MTRKQYFAKGNTRHMLWIAYLSSDAFDNGFRLWLVSRMVNATSMASKAFWMDRLCRTDSLPFDPEAMPDTAPCF